MNTDCVVPDWLHDIILGYGDPSSAHYSKMPNQIATLDFNDTFLSIDHLKASFPGYNVKVTVDNPDLHVPPFRWSQYFKYFWSGILAEMYFRWSYVQGSKGDALSLMKRWRYVKILDSYMIELTVLHIVRHRTSFCSVLYKNASELCL